MWCRGGRGVSGWGLQVRKLNAHFTQLANVIISIWGVLRAAMCTGGETNTSEGVA